MSNNQKHFTGEPRTFLRKLLRLFGSGVGGATIFSVMSTVLNSASRRALFLPHTLAFPLALFGAAFFLGCAGWSTSTTTLKEVSAEKSERRTEEREAEAKWYNQGYLKSIFGDFEPTEAVVIADAEERHRLAQRGFELATGAAACGACHAKQLGDETAPLSGGLLMQDRFGKVRAANITSDRETGIGEWNVIELMRAIRSSIDREGRPLSIDLHRGYRWMSDQDALAISTYLLETEPVSSRIERRELGGFERNRWGLFPQHEPVVGYIPAFTESPNKQFGRYVAQNVAQCGVCHTQGGGVLERGKPFAGPVARGPIRSLVRLVLYPGEKQEEAVGDGAKVLSEDARKELQIKPADPTIGEYPVIGPDIRGGEGLNEWSESDIVQYLSTGKTPSGELRDKRLCPWGFFRTMPLKYKQAVAAYIKTL